MPITAIRRMLIDAKTTCPTAKGKKKEVRILKAVASNIPRVQSFKILNLPWSSGGGGPKRGGPILPIGMTMAGGGGPRRRGGQLRRQRQRAQEGLGLNGT
mmetsp:Transcript_69449/g.219407  ORF Transcript_69449/g.219407 Transcript_69449/m.219407 type:complete len:100 (+) Transcript_69449:576-875(+)